MQLITSISMIEILIRLCHQLRFSAHALPLLSGVFVRDGEQCRAKPEGWSLRAEIPLVVLGLLVPGNSSKPYSCWLVSRKSSLWWIEDPPQRCQESSSTRSRLVLLVSRVLAACKCLVPGER